MKKEKIIGQIRIRAERDLTISDGALRLIFRVCSHIYTNPKAKLDQPFPLPWSQVAIWCGVSGENNARRRISELVDRGYLKCDGSKGCPPTNYFFLSLKTSKNGGHLIYNSFQEERLEERGGIGSLRSNGTKGEGLAASPTAFVPVAERKAKFAAALAAEGLEHLNKHQAPATVAPLHHVQRGTKTAFEEKHD